MCVLQTYNISISCCDCTPETPNPLEWVYTVVEHVYGVGEYVCECRDLCAFLCVWVTDFVFIGHFPQKSPMISGSFANNDLQSVAWVTDVVYIR